MKNKQTKQYAIVMLFCTVLMLLVSNCTNNKEMPITTSSDEALKLFLEGRENLELIEFDAAAQLLDQAIAVDEDFALANLYRWRTGVGGADNSLQYLRKAMDQVDNISEGEKYLILSYNAQAKREGVKVKEYLDKLLELFPSDKRVQFLLGNYYQNFEWNNKKAIDYFKRAKKIDKNYAPVYNSSGYCNIELGNYEEAENDFTHQIELIPNHPNPYDSYGDFLLKIGKYDESIKQFNTAYEKDETYTSAIAGVGDNYIFKGEYNTAREYYQKWYDKTASIGEKFAALNQIAATYVLEDEIEEALNIYKKYRSLADDNNRFSYVINSYQTEGFILSHTGKTAEGLGRYQLALGMAQNADTPEPSKTNSIITAKFQECWAIILDGNIEEALIKLNELDQITTERKMPDDKMWLNWLNGHIEYSKGNFKQAVNYFDKTWPNVVIVKYYTGEAYRKLGKNDKADEIFDEINNWNVASLQYARVKQLMK